MSMVEWNSSFGVVYEWASDLGRKIVVMQTYALRPSAYSQLATTRSSSYRLSQLICSVHLRHSAPRIQLNA
jgi:hypothetical protein